MIVWVQVPSPAYAEVAELADAHGSGPCGSNTMRVQVPPPARTENGNSLPEREAVQTVDKVPAKAGLFYIYNRFSGIMELSERRCFL